MMAVEARELFIERLAGQRTFSLPLVTTFVAMLQNSVPKRRSAVKQYRSKCTVETDGSLWTTAKPSPRQ
jgi:hypothetical protein